MNQVITVSNRFVVSAALVAFFSIGHAMGDDIYWANPATGNWSDPSNWILGSVPGVGDSAFIGTEGSSPFTVTLDENAHVARLTIEDSPLTFIVPPGGNTLLLDSGPPNNSPSDFQYPTVVELHSGALTCMNPLTLSGQLDWYGGLLEIHNVATISGPNGRLDIRGPNQKTLHATPFPLVIENGGVARWFDNGDILVSVGQPFKVNAGGTFEILGDGDMSHGGGPQGVKNYGYFVKTSGIGENVFGSGVAFENHGLLEIQTGTIRFGSDFSQTDPLAEILLGPEGTILVTGQFLEIWGGALLGEGTVASNALIKPQGLAAPGGKSNDVTGTLTVDLDYTQDPGSTLNIEIGGSGEGAYDSVSVGGAATIEGSILLVSIVDAYEIQAVDTFAIAEAATLTGTFTVGEGPFGPFNSGSDMFLSVVYSPTSVILEAVPDCNGNLQLDEDDQLDSDGDGVEDCVDNCVNTPNPGQDDLDNNSVGDACQADAIAMQLYSVTDAAEAPLATFAADINTGITTIYRGTQLDHILRIELDENGVDMFPNSLPTNSADRSFDAVYYEPNTPPSSFEFVGYTASCGCMGGNGTFAIHDSRGRVDYVATAQPQGTETVLEQFYYAGSTDDRLASHWRRNANGDLVPVETRVYDGPVGQPYNVTIRRPLGGNEEQYLEESYDATGRITSRREFPMPVAPGGDPTGQEPLETEYTYFQEPQGLSEERKVIHPSGKTDVWKWEITGTPYQSGTKVVETHVTHEDSPAVKKDRRVETYTYNSGYGDYRLTFVDETQIDGSTARTITYNYDDPAHPDRVLSEVHSAPGGVSYDVGLTTISFEYDDAGRMQRETRPGPNSVDVTTFFEYDTLGRLNRKTENEGGTNPAPRVTEYAYNDYDELIFTSTPSGLVRATGHDLSGRPSREYAFEGEGGLPNPIFDPDTPGTTVLLEEQVFEYHSVSGRLNKESAALSDTPFQSGTVPHVDTVHKFYGDDVGDTSPATGVYLKSTKVAAHDPSTYEYDVQGRLVRQTSAGGVRTATDYDGRNLVAAAHVGGDCQVDCLTTTTAYNEDGDVELVSHPNGTFTRSGYDLYGRLTSQERCDTASCGATSIETTFMHDDAGRVTLETVSNVSQTVTDYDNFGRAFRVRRRAGVGVDSNTDDAVTLPEYDAAGLVKRVSREVDTDPSVILERKDQVVRNTYNNLGQTVSVTRVNFIDPVTCPDPDTCEEETTYQYDAAGRQVAETVDPGGLNITTQFQYDALGRVTRITDPENHYVEQTYDSRGNLIRRVAFNSGGLARTQERWEYDDAGRLERTARMADADAPPTQQLAFNTDQVTTFGYNYDDRLTLEATYNMDSPVAHETTMVYDDNGRLELTTDAAGNWTMQKYAPFTGLHTRTAVCDLGNCPQPPNTDQACTDLSVRCTDFGYDTLARLTQETAQGTPDLVTHYQYDDADRRRRITDPEGIHTEFEYDLLGRQVKVTENYLGANPDPRITVSHYDRLGRLEYVIAYDEDQSVPPQSIQQRTDYGYDLFGRRTEVAYPDSISESDKIHMTYDKAGRLATRTDQRNIVVIYGYDKRGLLTSRTVPFESTGDSYGYDGVGRMAVAIRDIGSTRVSYTVFGYNDLSQMESEAQYLFSGPSVTVDFGYDQAGNRTSMDCLVTDFTCLGYDYDALNRVTTVDRGLNNLATYDYAGLHLDMRTLATDGGPLIFDPEYDEHRRISDVYNTGPRSVLPNISYTYYDAGNRHTADSSVSGNTVHDYAIEYTYDKLHRLTRADYTPPSVPTGGEIINMDPLGNRTLYSDTRTQDFWGYGLNNDANEYTTLAGGVVEYDAAGNLYEDEWNYRYHYDFENRLIKIQKFDTGGGGGGGGIGAQVAGPGGSWVSVAEYTYDALGRRIQAVLSDGTSTYGEIYYYNARKVLAEFASPPYSGTGSLKRYYVDGTTYIDEHLLMHNDGPPGNDYYYVPQELHTVAAVIDHKGNLVDAYTYDAYGQVSIFDRHGTPESASNVGNPYSFTGRRLDRFDSDLATPRLDFYHYRARAYTPVHGRFLQRDPLEYVDGMNLYEYVSSDPATEFDPLGLQNGVPSLLTGPVMHETPAILAPAANVEWFLEHYVRRSGSPVGLGPGEAADVMETAGVQEAIANALAKAKNTAKELTCLPGQTIDSEALIRVKGAAVARGRWRFIIGRFPVNGWADCRLRKSCACCKDGSTAFLASVHCSIRIAGQDTYDFHSAPATWIPGVPYNILWNWRSSKSGELQKKCSYGPQPSFPPRVMGGAGASF